MSALFRSPFLPWAVAAAVFLIPTLVAFFRDEGLDASIDLTEKPSDSLGIMPWLTLLLMCFATMVAWRMQTRLSQAGRQTDYHQELLRLDSDVTTRLESITSLVRGSADIMASGVGDRKTWQHFVTGEGLVMKFPEIVSMGFAVPVPESQRELFIRRTRADAQPLYKVVVDTPRDVYYLVKFADPEGRSGLQPGIDLALDKNMRGVTDRSRDSGEMAVSATTTAYGDKTHPTSVMVFPIYDAAAAHDTLTARLTGIRGWTFAEIRVGELLKGIMEKYPVLDVRAFDGVSTGGDTLFYSSIEGPHLDPVDTRSISIGGRTWTLQFFAHPVRRNPAEDARATEVLGIGILFSILSYLLVFALTRARARALTMAQRLTGILRDRNTALTNGPFSLVIVDGSTPEMPIIYVNTRFEKLTGYTSREAVGRNCRFLQGDERDEKVCSEIRAAVSEQRECRVLMRNFRKDGSLFWNELSIVPIRGDRGRVTQFVGIQNDVTDRIQADRRLVTQTAITRALGDADTLRAATPKVIQALAEAQGWAMGILWKVDGATQTLKCVDLWFEPQTHMDQYAKFCRQITFAKGTGLPGDVWAKGDYVLIPDIAKGAQVVPTPLLAKEGLNSVAAFPIANKQGTLGVIEFYGKNIPSLEKNVLMTIAGITNQLAQFMDREANGETVRHVPEPITPTVTGSSKSSAETYILDALDQGLIAMDLQGRALYVNPAACRLLGMPPAEIVGSNAHDLVHDHGDDAACALLRGLREGRTVIAQGDSFRQKNQPPIIVNYRLSALMEGGSIHGGVLAFTPARIESKTEEPIEPVRPQPTPTPKTFEPPSASVKPRPPEEIVDGAGKTVLFLEEDRAVRAEIGKMLEQNGYQVVTASNPGEALVLCERQLVDVIITDVILPHMSGRELLERLVVVRPNLKALFVSRHTQDSLEDLRLLQNGQQYLKVPFTPADLLGKLQETLS